MKRGSSQTHSLTARDVVDEDLGADDDAEEREKREDIWRSFGGSSSSISSLLVYDCTWLGNGIEEAAAGGQLSGSCRSSPGTRREEAEP